MTSGFVGFAAGVGVFSLGLRKTLPGPAWIAAAGASIATLGVAVFPLDRSDTIDGLHGVAAFSGYVALSLLPLLAAAQLAHQGHRGAALASRACGTVSAVALLTTLLGPAHGLFQRIGVTVGDAWIVWWSVSALRFVWRKELRA